MLEKIDLSKKLSKKEFNKIMDTLGERMGQAQRDARDAKIPIIIIFEGWRGARRSAIINSIMQQMDARGFQVYSTTNMSKEVLEQPFFTYFWQNLPAKGHIAVYHRSYYYLKNAYELEHKGQECPVASFERINAFEKDLTDDNYLVLKYFLHISEEQQKINTAKHDKTLGKAWRELNPAYDESGRYGEFLARYEKMLQATDTANAPWHVVPAEDLQVAQVDVYTSIVEYIEAALARMKQPKQTYIPRPEVKYDVLSKIKADKLMSKERYRELLKPMQRYLRDLQIEMYQKGYSAALCFEGWDAGGKGGAIRRLTDAMDPLGYCVHPVAAPNAVERQFNHLWRFWVNVPKKGSIAIFDRTWYGRVMVERVEGFATPEEWQRSFAEMNEMEVEWVDANIVVLKFWLQIDKDEQLRRFNERQNNPAKNWKITDEDWRNRDKWEAYEDAVNEMLVRTDTSYAPWVVVEGNNKYYARLKVIKSVIEAFEKKLGKKPEKFDIDSEKAAKPEKKKKAEEKSAEKSEKKEKKDSGKKAEKKAEKKAAKKAAQKAEGEGAAAEG